MRIQTLVSATTPTTCDNDSSPEITPASCQEASLCASKSPQGATRLLVDDPDLALVIEKWANLTLTVRAGIVAKLKASGQGTV